MRRPLLILPLIPPLVTLAYDNGPASSLPPMGWNTWCTNDLCGLVDHCSEHLIHSVVNSMVSSGLRDLGYTYINLDDCWSGHSRDSQGRLQPSPLFPSGMQDLADFVHSKGMKLGLYSCVGTQTCKYNRPGSYGNFEIDAQTFASWGVDFVKADYCHKPSNETSQDLYAAFSNALNQTGREILFSLCEWGEDDVWNWGSDVGQMARVQMDHLPIWNYPPQAAGVGYGQGVSNIIEWMGDLQPSKYTKQHGYLDPDFLMTLMLEDRSAGSNDWTVMPYVDSKTEYSFWAMWSSPLIFATDPRDMSDAKRSILMNEEVISINQDELLTAGDRIIKDDVTAGRCFQAWSRPLFNGDVAVIFYYPGDDDGGCDVSVSWADDVEVLQDVKAARDLWEKKDLDVDESGRYEVHLERHGVQMLRLGF
jgi:alpha-galactosidase